MSSMRASVFAPKITRPVGRPRKLALLLPAHNEELIIAATIRSAAAAGQKTADIYVVDDASTDKTYLIAVELLGKANVLRVRRSGKALAVQKAIKKFNIISRYSWLHIADADSVFSPGYFRLYRGRLKSKDYAAAIGFVQSLRGNWISKYRVFSYTYGQQILRRFQSWAGMISVFPGPVTSFRTDILPRINFDTDSLTEDFDITLQFHRLKLGKILYIPQAVNYTQDPQTLRDFCKQTMRWYRGFFQGIKKYRIGTKLQGIDVYVGYQLLETLTYLVQMLVLLPLVVIATHRWVAIPMVMLADYFITTLLAVFTSVAAKRLSILSIMPLFYCMRLLEVTLFVSSFVEVFLLGRFKTTAVGWQTEGRRYTLNDRALRDTAGARG